MARYACLTTEDKIARTQAAIEKAKERYERLQAELQELIIARDNERKEEVFLAISRSGKTIDEVLEFLNGCTVKQEGEAAMD